jgi:hypothetical protein
VASNYQVHIMNSPASSNCPSPQIKHLSRVPVIALPLAVVGFALMLLCAGCGPKAPTLSSQDMKAFESAPAEVKQTWEKALAADRANDYVNAAALLNSLEQMTLSDPQKQALAVERDAFGQRLMKAAEKNDPAAVKAIQNSTSGRNEAQKPLGQ